MTFVIPMAGRGQRFADAGYAQPKFLLEAHGQPLLMWSVNSLPLDLATRCVFVALREHEREFRVEARLNEMFGASVRVAVVVIDTVTGGQAETVLAAQHHIDPDLPLLIYNIDTMFQSTTLRGNLLREDVDGVLGSFVSREARFSFAAVDAAGRVVRVTEKEPISDHALTGLYHFGRAGEFLDIAGRTIAERRSCQGEFYVAPLYNELIDRGAHLILDQAVTHHVLGTPEEYETFVSLSLPSIHQ
jgi:dTDP-glucose pyrophosphorylase